MDYLEVASYVGTIAFAISGIILGIRKDLDIMGVFILSFLTSSGGGVLRDVLLNKVPAIFSESYVYISIIALIISFKFLRYNNIIDKLEGKFVFRLSDTIGLVAFSIGGAAAALSAGHNSFTVIIMSFLTAVGGGVVRDILVNEVPEVLKSGFYGSVAVLVGAFMCLGDYYSLGEDLTVAITFFLGLAIRCFVIYNPIKLPKI